MHCPSCDHDNPAESRFCGDCGAALSAPCDSCGIANEPGQKFCRGCGVRLGAAASPAPDPTNPSMPAPAASGATATSTQAEAGERRQLTVLFCDLVGSTQLSQQIDAEEWREVVARYQRAASTVVERFGGHVAKNLGDGVLIYFGWPAASEDDPERAVRAGLAIVDATTALNTALADDDGTRLAIRVGMHTGPVVIADGGEVFGETANIAARVQDAAEPNTVVMTASTQRLVAGIFVVEDLGPRPLKGVSEPMALYRAVQPSGVRSRLDVAAGTLSRFVGRDVELATLVDRWERAEDGEGQAVIVFAEAGIGKSRLVYRLREHLAKTPHTWLECGASPYTQGSPFHPLKALVAQGLAFTEEDGVPERIGKLKAGLRSLSSAENVALLADCLGLEPPTALQLSPELQRRKTIDLLAQWNLAMSAIQPLVLFVEDIHWCDASTLELLGRLLAQSSTARILLVANARPEFVSPWPARSNLTQVQLARLTKRQSRDMIVSLAGSDLAEETIEALIARADGVPLYIEELTKAVIEPGATRSVDAIPSSLADSLMARLDRLSTAKEVAQRAAVLGREFGYELLAATAGLDEAALLHGLARLIDGEILFGRGEPPTAAYTFKHALIQESAYQSLLKRTCQQFHAEIAAVMEERFPALVAAEPEALAWHYDHAGLADAAVVHYQRAAARAQARWANEEAIGYLRRALALLETVPETPQRCERELDLQMILGVSLAGARGWSHPEYEQAYVRARELLALIGESDRKTGVYVALAAARYFQGQLASAAEVSREALEAARRTGEPYDLFSAHYSLYRPLFFQGDILSALDHAQKGLDLYDRDLHQRAALDFSIEVGSSTQAQLGWCHVLLGRYDLALVQTQEALASARELDHPLTLATALFHAARIHIERGEFAECLASSEELLAVSEQFGFPLLLGLGRFYRSAARVEVGEDPEANVAAMEEALGELAGVGSGIGAPGLLADLATALRRVGRSQDAQGIVEFALRRADEQGQHYRDAELHCLRGEILLDNDPLDQHADAHFAHALELARTQGTKTYEIRIATSQARAWQRQGRAGEARELLQPVYDWFTEGFDTRDLKEAKALLEELA